MVGAKHILAQFITFCGVGGINTVLSLLIILLLSEVLHVHYVPANMAGYGAGLISGFIMHKHLTFRSEGHTHDRTRALPQQFFSFLIVFGVGYLLQLAALMLLVERLHSAPAPAQIMAWVVYVAVSFTGNKYFTFYNGSARGPDGSKNGSKHE